MKSKLNMKNELLLICSLLVSLFVLGKCAAETTSTDIKVKSSSRGAKVTCPEGYQLYKEKKNLTSNVEYNDINTGEYECKNNTENIVKIYLKFRTCDNCIELDIGSAVGMIVGQVVATSAIAVSIYLIARHLKTGTTAPDKKGSDRQRLVPNEMNSDDGNYQKLRPRRNDVYDKLRK